MKALGCVIVACLVIAYLFITRSSNVKSSFVVQDRTGQTIELSNLRYYTAGNIWALHPWDIGRGNIEITVTKGSIKIIKVIPRNFEDVQSVEIIEGSGENIWGFKKDGQEEKLNRLIQERYRLSEWQREDEERKKLLEKGQRYLRELAGEKPIKKTTLEESVSKAPPGQKSQIDELDNNIKALQDSLKELKVRVTYTSGETVEGIRKRNDWQNEDYIYGTSKESDKEVRLDIAKVMSIKVKTDE